jgi:hypothetical protein
MERSMLVRTLIRTAGLAASVAAIATAADAWNVSINGRRSSDLDKATAVAIDPSNGNVFVAGARQVESSNTQFVVGKLTSTGEKVWHHIVEGTADVGTSAGAAAVAVDPGGFVFVAGTIGNLNTGTDIVIMKIDGRAPSKNVLWTRVVDVLGFDDLVSAITLAPDGGVAVVGSARAASGATNGYLMKFAGDGTDAWPSPQIVSGTSLDGLNSINAAGTLPNGDVAVVGSVLNNGSNFDLIVGRFDGRTGTPQWLAAVNDTAVNRNDLGTALAIASNGDIVAGGQTSGRFSGGDFSVFRFNGSGTLLWRTTIDSGFFDAVRAIAVGPGGDIVAGGTLELPSGPNSSAFVVVDLDATGRERWRYSSPGPASFLEARALAFDSNGNPVATGLSQDSNLAATTFAVVALAKDTGTVLWKLPVVGTAPLQNEGHAIAVNSATGFAVAVGVTQNERTSFDMTAIGILNGAESWRRTVTGLQTRVDRDDAALALAVDPVRNAIAVAGFAQNSGTGLLGTPHEFRVVKLRKNGAIAWKYDFHDALPHFNNAAVAIAVDPTGDFFAAGRTCSTSSTSCFTVVRVSAQGKELWRTVLPGSGEADALVLDPQDGNVIVAGKLTSAKGTAFAVVKLDANTGRTLWPASVEDPPLGSANALVLTTRGTVAVAGTVEGKFAVLEYSTGTGAIVARGGLLNGQALSVAFDSREGSVVAVGQRPSSGLVGSLLTVAKFDGAGTAIWSKDFGDSNSTSIGVAVAVNQSTESIAVGGMLNSGTSTTLLLESDGREQWRSQNSNGFDTNRTNAVAFAGNTVIAAGQLADGGDVVFQVTGFADDGTEAWGRAFRGSSESGEGAAAAVALDESRGSIFVAGVVVNNPTGPDMFTAGLDFNGADLPEVPLLANR